MLELSFDINNCKKDLADVADDNIEQIFAGDLKILINQLQAAKSEKDEAVRLLHIREKQWIGEKNQRITLQSKLDELVEREPICWLTKFKNCEDHFEFSEANYKATNPEYWTDAFPVYAKPIPADKAPQGYKLAPIEPSEEMICIGMNTAINSSGEIGWLKKVYASMLSAIN